MSKPLLIVIAGPTAVGKTSLSIELANWLDAEIVSADSRQFYREMSIGTAKPTKKELSKAKHHFINTHSIQHPLNAGIYERECMAILSILFETRKTLILTGGSGLFIDAVCDGLDDLPAENVEIRETLNRRFEEEGLGPLAHELTALDPEYAQKIDLKNPHRIIRGLEVCLATGKKISSLHSTGHIERHFEILRICINRDRQELYERINHRVDEMMGNNLLDEVKNLEAYKDLTPLQTVGYQELFSYLDGDISLQEATDLIKRNSRRYAKRQLTWFRRNKEYHWFHPDQEKDIKSLIEKHLGKS